VTLKPGLGVIQRHRNRHMDRFATYDLLLTFHSNHRPVSFFFSLCLSFPS